MAIITSYPNDTITTDDDRLLSVDSSGATKLTPASNLKTYLGFSTDPSGGWVTPIGTTGPSTVTYNGNRSYNLQFNGTDLTGVLSEGMRLRTTRTVLPQTQVTSLNGTNQYWSKTAPAGMTFTDDFTAGAWVKLTSYPASASTVMSRYSLAGGGWQFRVESTGQVAIQGLGPSSNPNEIATTFQSLPLNKWVHIVATLDMSGNISNTYIDGVSVPNLYNQVGGGTVLTQSGNLEIGSANGGIQLFPGKIAQVFVSSSILTQAQVRSIYSQGITPADVTALNIISAYSFNGNATDLNTTNANNLTANGSVTATNADSPFSTGTGTNLTSGFDYAIVMSKPVFATNTTMTVSVPEGCAIPTSGGVSAVVYSSQFAPFGFPGIGNNLANIKVASGFTTSSTAAVQVPGLTAPVYIQGPSQKVRISFNNTRINCTAVIDVSLTLWSGAVGSGTLLETVVITEPTAGYQVLAPITTTLHALAGNQTFNVGVSINAGTTTLFPSMSLTVDVI